MVSLKDMDSLALQSIASKQRIEHDLEVYSLKTND